MNSHDLCLSDEEIEQSKQPDQNANSMSFTLGLVNQGLQGKLRTRNRTPYELQRSTVSSFQGGRDKRRPDFTVTCNALVMIHGQMSPNSHKKGTLLVYEFKFNTYGSTRIKSADISFKFMPQRGNSGSLSVAQLRPNMETRMEIPGHNHARTVKNAIYTNAKIGPLEYNWEHSKERVTNHHTFVTGDNPGDAWGNRYMANFYLAENPHQKTGILTRLRTAILLEREDDANFFCHPFIKVEPSFAAHLATLGTTRDPDDPIQFNVQQPPFNKLGRQVPIDRNNLLATDLDGLADYLLYHYYDGAVKVVG